MNEMVDYIFGSLKSSEAAIYHIQKSMRQQAKINKTLWLSAMVMSIYIIAEDIHNREQDKRIEKLTNEVKKLERTEGD